MAKTVDNLCVDVSTNWAQSREMYEATFLEESREISSQSKVSITSPIYYGELQTLFGTEGTKATWALFSMPQSFESTRKRLFTEQLAPSCGTPELQETARNRVQAVAREYQGTAKTITTEQDALCNLLDRMHLMDELIIDFNSKRIQYQKG